ncbi:hypothetical protein RGU70_16840 [Herbaspirillum sp. RTI4]|nr:hypothetical protein [Herbaspirillum sp. RTI4]MDY7579982.1 hypothetical protein [Herbaspirillum sp. RTI4]
MLKKPLSVPEGPGKSDEEIEEAAIQHLADLALQFAAAQRRGTTSADLTQAQADCQRLLRKTLAQDQDDILYEALDRCRYADIDAYLWLKDAIEEAASVALIRGQAGQQFEINAFLIPLFAHSTGGLERDKNFQNQQAFDRLTKSFTEAGLESPTARVVLVNHAYPLEQIDRITYCQLSSMVREAYASMTNAKMAAAPAIAASIGEWQESDFGPEDSAIELRFLLGFALKTEDDPFYLPPADDAGSDAYFSAR